MSTPQLRPGEVYLGQFLLERLAQLGVLPVFGVPGDFTLAFLDLVEDHPVLDWVGCANELNAAYAADGYARTKQAQLNSTTSTHDLGGVRGIGALVTTFGVGELSAINGVAGAYSERVPIIHIVGVPSMKLQKAGALLHHTLGDGKFKAFQKAAEGFSAAQAILESAEGAPEEIDRILRVALEKARPVYLTLPTDLVFAPVSSTLLETPLVAPSLEVSKEISHKAGDEARAEILDFVTNDIVRLWDQAKRPIIIIDACAIRYGVQHLVKELIDATGVMYFTTPMAKSVLSEDPAAGFGGVYSGGISPPAMSALVESADLTLLIGQIASDFNTGSFSYKVTKAQSIELHSDHTKVQYASFPGISFHELLPALIKLLRKKDYLSSVQKEIAESLHEGTHVPEGDDGEMIKQAAFWPMWGKFLRPHDITVQETGTSSFGMNPVPLPMGATSISQVLYGSIGWSVGATLGALKAAQEFEEQRRTILFVGDGSLQLTVQEIATMMRQGLKPIIVVLNNDGYVIERLIHGETRVYNDISRWSWQTLLDFFNADNTVPHRSWLAKTRGEFVTILNDVEFQKADRIQLLEVRMGRLDAPVALERQAKLSAQLNSE